MRGDLHKLFAFLSSRTTENHRRPRSASIACARDAVRKVNNSPLHNGDGNFDKEAPFPNSTLPRKSRRQSQTVIIDRWMSTSKALSRRKLGPVLTTPSAVFERMVVNVNLDNSVIMEDFDNEDIRKVWSSLQSRSIFNETSVQDGYLTTTLCSTELWVSWPSQIFLMRDKFSVSFLYEGWCLVKLILLPIKTDTWQSIPPHLVFLTSWKMPRHYR